MLTESRETKKSYVFSAVAVVYGFHSAVNCGMKVITPCTFAYLSVVYLVILKKYFKFMSNFMFVRTDFVKLQ